MTHVRASRVNPAHIKPGDWVAFRAAYDATRFEVIDRNGFKMTVRQIDSTGQTYAAQTTDASLVRQHWKAE